MSLLAQPARSAPRAVFRALVAGGCVLVATSAACDRGPLTPDAAAPPIVVRATVAGADTLRQVGFDFTVELLNGGALAQPVQLFVDSGTVAERRYAYSPAGLGRTTTLAGVAFAPAAGRHTFTFVAGDSTGRTTSATVARYFDLPDREYRVTVLPDLGFGGGARGIATTWDVAGWVATASGRRRPAVWHAGALRVLPVSDSADVTAERVNASGDVLLQSHRGPTPTLPPDYPTAFNAGWSAARVLRADGELLTLGPRLARFDPRPSQPASPFCCNLAADLNDRREAIGSTYTTADFDQSVVFDVARGTRVDSTDSRLLALNGAGHAVGLQQTRVGSGALSAGLVAYGWSYVPGAATPGPRFRFDLGLCGSAQGQPITPLIPIDFDDDHRVLGNECGNARLSTPAGTQQYVDRQVGPGRQVHLSRQGGVVAALDDSTGAIHVWEIARGRVVRARVPAGWRIDSLVAVHGSGALAAQGTDPATRRRAALLLTPADP